MSLPNQLLFTAVVTGFAAKKKKKQSGCTLACSGYCHFLGHTLQLYACGAIMILTGSLHLDQCDISWMQFNYAHSHNDN